MKYKPLKLNITLAVFVLCTSLFNSCTKPWKDLKLVLNAHYIDHNILLQFLDADTSATNPYPSNVEVTVSGPAVTDGLIYDNSGNKLGSAPSSPIEGSLVLATKPNAVIATNRPAKFTINAKAPGYLEATTEVTVNATDSVLRLDVPMVKISNPPAGVSVAQKNIAITNGVVATNISFAVSNPGKKERAEVLIPAHTEVQDVSGNRVLSSSPVQSTIVHFDGRPEESITAIPGGTNDVTTIIGGASSVSSFEVGGAVAINMTTGGAAVRKFSAPIQVTVDIDPNTINPNTGTVVKAGDNMEVFSRENGRTTWTKEAEATVFTSGGQLKATMHVHHLSTWIIAFRRVMCSSYLKVDVIKTNINGASTHLVRVYDKAGRLKHRGIYRLLNGQSFTLSNLLDATTDLAMVIHESTSAGSTILASVFMGYCPSSATVQLAMPADRPELNFDLKTQCRNGTFTYSGPIDYKQEGSDRWLAFTEAAGGKLTTSLLEFNKTYQFRIIYKGKAWIRSKTVEQSQFRRRGTSNSWDYWGKDASVQQTFFSAPTACD